ncbi:MAG: J domain-containing protein [Chloroflexota bacterium]
MRFDTRRISAYLVNQLQSGRPHVEVTYDGGDLIRVSLENNQNVHIYLIENPITVYEIRGIVAANTGVGTYTLFILWRDLLLPIDGVRYRPNDWMAALLALHGDKIYAFDAYYGEEFYIFPVYFEGVSAERIIRHGTTIDATRMFIETVSVTSPLIAGVWRVANFEASRQAAGDSDDTPVNFPNTPMTLYYRQLGIAESANRAAIKRAYRRLARKYHPDLNTDPAATVRMQQINEAYERILADLKSRGFGDD